MEFGYVLMDGRNYYEEFFEVESGSGSRGII